MAIPEPSNTLARPQSDAPASSHFMRKLAERFADSAAPRAFSAYAQSIWRSQFNLVMEVLGNEPLVIAAPAMFAALKKAESAAVLAEKGFGIDLVALRAEILAVIKTAEVKA